VSNSLGRWTFNVSEPIPQICWFITARSVAFIGDETADCAPALSLGAPRVPKSNPPSLLVIGHGASRVSVLVAELDNVEQALTFAKKAAEETGRTVTVRNDKGEPKHWGEGTTEQS
jgi:hypothetical protein